MSTKQKTTIGALPYLPVLPGEEIPEQNIESEQALERMMEALERRRQKPFFDPTLLQMAAGFLAPTKTGGFGESLGYAAQNLSAGMQAERQREAEDIAFETGIAAQRANIEQMKRRDKEFARLLGDTGEERVPPGVEEIVVKGRGEQGQPIPGTEAYTPPGLPRTMGVPFMPPNPNILTSREYYEIAAKDPKISAAEAVKTAQEIERNRYIDNERGVIDRRTGLRFEVTGSDLVERQIVDPDTGDVGTYKIPQNIAIRLDHNQLTGNRDVYDYYARVALGKRNVQRPRGAEAQGQAPRVSGAAPSGGRAPEGGLKSEQQKEVEKITRQKRAEEETKLDVEAEAALGANSKSAREMFNATQRLQKAVTESPLVIGVLQSPTLSNAVLSLIDEGVQIGNTTIRLGGLQSAIIKSLPGVTKEDIANLERVLSSLAEIELKYTQLYLKGQGQVTEGERLIVRRLGGTEKSSPEFLKTQAKLIQMRSQFDIDVIDTFRRLKEQNPNATWTQFQRSSAYREMENDYDKQIAKQFDLEPAIPSSERGKAGSGDFNVEAFKKKLEERGK